MRPMHLMFSADFSAFSIIFELQQPSPSLLPKIVAIFENEEKEKRMGMVHVS